MTAPLRPPPVLRPLALAAVVPVLLLAACGTGAEGEGASDRTTAASSTASSTAPSHSAAASAGTLTTAMLLTNADTTYGAGRRWYRTIAEPASTDGTVHLCEDDDLATLGATEALSARFQLRTSPQGSDLLGPDLNEFVIRFADTAAATAARERMAAAVTDCSAAAEKNAGVANTRIEVEGTTRIQVPGGAAGEVVATTRRPVDIDLDPSGTKSFLGETGLAVVGDTLVLLVSEVVGTEADYPPTAGPTPVERMLPRAVERVRARS
ncbi:hypothetical protein [Nocardioides sp.]|uniref:hypothetical protein n=1 Tax=Nocardioides sp. TaxID=35761 RepID=UPI003514D7B5